MKQKRQKDSEMLFTGYLDKDEYLIWVRGSAKNRRIMLRQMSLTEMALGLFHFALSISLLFILTFYAPHLLWIALIWLLLSIGYLLEFKNLSPKYYAISNKRIFTLQGKSLHTEKLTHLQEIIISKKRNGYFNLEFLPLSLTYGIEQGMKEDYPIDFPAHRLEDLSEKDAQAAYDLLMAEREDRAEELDLPQ